MDSQKLRFAMHNCMAKVFEIRTHVIAEIAAVAALNLD